MTPLARQRSGATLLLVILMIPVLLGFVAFVVDLGYARVVQAQLQAAADAASTTGASELDGSLEGLSRAEAVAIFAAGLNVAHGAPVALGGDDVDLGVWDEAAGTFTGSSDPELVNAVRVRARVEGLTPFFGRAVFAREALAASVVSVAARGRELGAGRVPYYLPFALPVCAVEGQDPEEIMDMVFQLNPAGEDNTGWALVGEGTNANSLRDHLDDILPCIEQWMQDGTVEEACAPAEVEQSVDLDNGMASSVLRTLADAMANGIPWDEELWGPLPPQDPNSTIPANEYGTVLAGPIPLFDEEGYCDGNSHWNETFPVVAFIWAIIYDVDDRGSAQDRNVWVRLDLSQIYEVGEWPGGDPWGVVWTGPSVLVR